MVGGSPIYFPSYPAAPPQQQLFLPPSPRPPAAPPGLGAMPPAPTVRGVAPEAPAPMAVRAPVTIPSPEQLGVAPAGLGTTPAPRPDVAVDWTAARARLQQLGAVSFFLERLSTGGYRFSCWLPHGAASPERIDGVAGTEAEALGLCLERAGRWVAVNH